MDWINITQLYLKSRTSSNLKNCNVQITTFFWNKRIFAHNVVQFVNNLSKKSFKTTFFGL